MPGVGAYRELRGQHERQQLVQAPVDDARHHILLTQVAVDGVEQRQRRDVREQALRAVCVGVQRVTVVPAKRQKSTTTVSI